MCHDCVWHYTAELTALVDFNYANEKYNNNQNKIIRDNNHLKTDGHCVLH